MHVRSRFKRSGEFEPKLWQSNHTHSCSVILASAAKPPVAIAAMLGKVEMEMVAVGVVVIGPENR